MCHLFITVTYLNLLLLCHVSNISSVSFSQYNYDLLLQIYILDTNSHGIYI